MCQACEQEDDLSTDLFIPKKLNTNKEVRNNKKTTVPIAVNTKEDTLQDIQTNNSDNDINSIINDHDYNQEEEDNENYELDVSEFNDQEEKVYENSQLDINLMNSEFENINEIHNVNESDNITTISNKSTKKKKDLTKYTNKVIINHMILMAKRRRRN